MNVARSFHNAMCLCAMLGMTAFLIADERPLLIPFALIAAGVARLVSSGARSLRPMALPRAVVTLLVFAAILQAAASVATGERDANPIVSILGLFLTIITAVKLFDRRAARDDAQLLTLCLLDAIAAVLTSNALGVGVVLLIMTPVAIRAAMLLQVWTGLFRHGDGPERTQMDQPAPLAARTRAPVHLTAITVAASIACATAAAIIFVGAPRGLAANVMGRFGQVQQTSIGFTDNARLGTAGFLTEDPTPVMDIQYTDLEGTNLGGPDTMLYLRGAVKDVYSPERWRWEETDGQSRLQAVIPARNAWTPFKTQTGRTSILREARITLRGGPGSGRYLFTLWRPVSVTPERGMTLEVSSNALAIRGRVNDTDPEGGRPGGDPRVDYRMRIMVGDEGGGEGIAPPTPSFDSAPIRDLALRVLADAGVRVPVQEGDLRTATTAIRDYLRDNFSYTTQMVAPRAGQDPIEMFLFETRRGHCEYFASAMTAMCQSVGIPARLVLGYVASEYNPLTEQYLVRESNAHAWVEVHVGRGRWVHMDPSPPGDIARLHSPGEGPFSMVRRWWDALEFSWARSVVSFDRTSQRRLLSTPDSARDNQRQRVENISDAIAQRLKTWRQEIRRGQVFGLIAWGVAGIAGIILLVRTVPELFSRLRGWIGDPTRQPAHRRALLAAPFFAPTMRALAKAGLPRPEYAGTAEHARDLGAIDPELARAVERIGALFYRVRFGPGTLTPEELGDGNAQAARVVQRLRALRAERRGGARTGV